MKWLFKGYQIIIEQWRGRFGNNLIQLINAIYLAEKTHSVLVFPKHDHLMRKKFDFRRKPREINYAVEGDDCNQIIKNDFFYFNIICQKWKVTLKDKRRICKKYISPLFKNLSAKKWETACNQDYWDETLVIHMRSGDIFSTLDKPGTHPDYPQPPLSMYKMMIRILTGNLYEKYPLLQDPDENKEFSFIESNDDEQVSESIASQEEGESYAQSNDDEEDSESIASQEEEESYEQSNTEEEDNSVESTESATSKEDGESDKQSNEEEDNSVESTASDEDSNTDNSVESTASTVSEEEAYDAYDEEDNSVESTRPMESEEACESDEEKDKSVEPTSSTVSEEEQLNEKEKEIYHSVESTASTVEQLDDEKESTVESITSIFSEEQPNEGDEVTAAFAVSEEQLNEIELSSDHLSNEIEEVELSSEDLSNEIEELDEVEVENDNKNLILPCDICVQNKNPVQHYLEFFEQALVDEWDMRGKDMPNEAFQADKIPMDEIAGGGEGWRLQIATPDCANIRPIILFTEPVIVSTDEEEESKVDESKEGIHNIKQILIVTEKDDNNPCVMALKEWSDAVGLQCFVQKTSFQNDMKTLLNAKYLVSSRSSFSEIIPYCSSKCQVYLEPFFYSIYDKDHRSYTVDPTKEDTEEIDFEHQIYLLKDYIKRGEWSSSSKQKNEMLSYDSSNIDFIRFPKSLDSCSED